MAQEWAISEISFAAAPGSWAISKVTAYAEPVDTAAWAISEVTVTAVPSSTTAAFLRTGGEWVRCVPHVYEDGVWSAV